MKIHELAFRDVLPGSYTLGTGRSVSGSIFPVKCKITRPFIISEELIVQDLWQRVMGTEPWHSLGVLSSQALVTGPRYPAVGVTWHEATEFCQNLSKRWGRRFQLPTEVQWEYALRAGTSTEYFWGDSRDLASEYAVYREPGGAKIADLKLSPVCSRKPNPWGLYDMAGLVKEWVRDKCDSESDSPYLRKDHYPPEVVDFCSSKGRLGMIRNGSFTSGVGCLQSSFKILEELDKRNIEVGFRIVAEA